MSIELSDLERQTRQIFADYMDATEWDQGVILTQNVFTARWSCSMPCEQIERIAAAMHNLANCDLQPTLTKLVKAKVLRSRTQRGMRLYEVNY